jgi:hypothetical protein
MDPSCPHPGRLAAYAARLLEGAEVEVLEVHLARCSGCRQEFLELKRFPGTRAVPSRRLAFAAAAALLLAALPLSFWMRKETPAPLPGPSSVAGPLRLSPGQRFSAGRQGREWALPEGARLALERAGEARVLEAAGSGLVLALEKGRLWMNAGPGACAVRLPGAEVSCRDAEFAVSFQGTAATVSGLLFREALADQAPVFEVWCRRGVCRVSWGEGEGGSRILTGGMALAVGPGREAVAVPLSWEDMERHLAWRWEGRSGDIPLDSLVDKGVGISVSRTGQGTLVLKPLGEDGSLRLGEDSGGDYRLELRLRALKDGGNVGLAFPALCRSPYWVLPGGIPAGRWTCLAVERSGGRIRLWRDGALSSTVEAVQVDPATPAASGPALGLWGGAEVELQKAVWRAWEPEVLR